MKKILTAALFAIGASGFAQQLTNSSLAEVETGWNNVGVQPKGWKGSNVNQTVKVIGETNKQQQLIWQTDEKDGIKMVNKFVGVGKLGSNAPAYVTLGQPWVYAEMNVSNCDGGTYGSIDFSYRPDACSVQYKRSMGTEKTSEVAQIIVYAWKGTTTKSVKWQPTVGSSTSQTANMTDRDRDITGHNTDGVTFSSDFKLVSNTEYSIEAQNNSDWQTVTIPLDYKDTETVPTKLNVVLSSADYYNRSNIGKENTLYVKNFNFIYYHALSDLKYDGSTVSGFSETKTSYDLSSTEYDEEKLEIVKKGVGATVETSYDEISGLLTITVKGNDYSVNSESVTTYTVQFKPIVTTYNEKTATPDYVACAEPTDATAQIYQTKDGSKRSLVLKKAVEGYESLTLKGITVASDGTISESQSLEYEGEDITVSVEGKIVSGVVRANIVVTKADGSTVSAVISDVRQLTIDGTKTVEQVEQPGIYNVTIARTFKKGWNTWFMPYSVEPSQLGSEVKAQEFATASNGVLNFTTVDDELVCGVPYIVWFPAETKSDISFFTTELYLETGEDISVGSDGEFAFLGNYEAGFDMEGKYGVADYKGDGIQRLVKGLAGSTLPATCAYFTSNASNAEGMVLHLEGETTAISAATLQPVGEEGPVFSLQGVKVSDGATQGLPAGIYVKAGKKVIIK